MIDLMQSNQKSLTVDQIRCDKCVPDWDAYPSEAPT